MASIRQTATTAGRAVASVALRPSLWITAIRVAGRLVPDQWWRRAPFLPVPDAALLSFRSVTQYGDPNASPTSEDIIAWLRWCKVEARAVASS